MNQGQPGKCDTYGDCMLDDCVSIQSDGSVGDLYGFESCNGGQDSSGMSSLGNASTGIAMYIALARPTESHVHTKAFLVHAAAVMQYQANSVTDSAT